MVIGIIGIIIGLPVLGAGIYYLIKKRMIRNRRRYMELQNFQE